MTDLRKAAEMALEVFDGPVLKDATEHAMRLRKACDLLRQALAMENFSEVNQEIEEELKQPKQDHIRDATKKVKWVGLTDEEIGVWPVWSPEIEEFVRTIELKLKEKNT
jgi:hypothetical protein